MASFHCRCGKRLTNIEAPNDIEWRVYSMSEWNEIMKLRPLDPVCIPFPELEVWRCPDCERIYVFKDNHVIKEYDLHHLDEEVCCLADVCCKCGGQLADGSIWMAYSDIEWDAITNVDFLDPKDIPHPSTEIRRCAKCERVYVFRDNRLIKCYVLHNVDGDDGWKSAG